MRFRSCGCDARDQGTYVQDGTSPLLCASCDEMPCCWVARFGCRISGLTDVRGDVYMRVLCAFEERCRFVSVYASYADCPVTTYGRPPSQHNDGFSWCGTPGGYPPRYEVYNACTWLGRNPVDGFAITDGWILTLSNLSSVTLENSQNGAVYAAVAEWDCTGQNTLWLTDEDGDEPLLPRSVCVSPRNAEIDGVFVPPTDWSFSVLLIRSALNLCEPATTTVEHDSCDDEIPCDYASESDRAACCDDCCPKSLSYTITCGAESQVISGTSTTSDVAGVSSPAGRSYMITGSVMFGGTTYSLKFVTYCDGTDWLLDVYCDDVLDQTGLVVDFTCCPLAGTVTIPELSCMVCGIETVCCPDDPIPATLTADIASSCSLLNAGSVELTYNAGTDKWEGSFTNTYEFLVTFWCFENTWNAAITGADTPDSCSLGWSQAVGDCSAPLDVAFGVSGSIECPLGECSGAEVSSTTITVTA